MKNKRAVVVLFTSTLGVVVACGGSGNSDLFGAGGDGGGSGADAMANPSGSDATVDGASEGGGGDGGSKKDASKDAAGDAATDATVDAGSLCVSTGGTESTSLCCKSAGDFPDTCKVGACGCSPPSSHTVASCLCPLNDCYDAILGCRPR